MAAPSSARSLRVCVAAVGARTSVGLQAFPAAAAVNAGIARIVEHPYLKDLAGEPFMVAMDRTIEAVDRLDRMHTLAASVLTEILDALPAPPRSAIPVYLGLPEIGPHFSEESARRFCGRLASDLAQRAQLQILPVCEGSAAGIISAQRAVQAIEGALADLVIVAGVDSWVDVDLLEGLDESGRLMSGKNRWGFPPGEGCGALLLCNHRVATGLGMSNLGWIASLSVTTEAAPMHSRAICIGEGLGAAMREAAVAAGTPVTTQYCDIDGERYREHELAHAVLRLPSASFVNSTHYVTPVPCWGHVGAATAPLLSILPIVAHARRFSPGAWPMVWCGSENGRRGAMVLHLPS